LAQRSSRNSHNGTSAHEADGRGADLANDEGMLRQQQWLNLVKSPSHPRPTHRRANVVHLAAAQHASSERLGQDKVVQVILFFDSVQEGAGAMRHTEQADPPVSSQ